MGFRLLSRVIAHSYLSCFNFIFFFFTDAATTGIYTLSLHDALPISEVPVVLDGYADWCGPCKIMAPVLDDFARDRQGERSEEHTSELQSPMYLVCRLLLEKKKYQTGRREGQRYGADNSAAATRLRAQ